MMNLSSEYEMINSYYEVNNGKIGLKKYSSSDTETLSSINVSEIITLGCLTANPITL